MSQEQLRGEVVWAAAFGPEGRAPVADPGREGALRPLMPCGWPVAGRGCRMGSELPWQPPPSVTMQRVP